MPNGILTDYDTATQRKIVDAYVQSRGGTTKGKSGVGASRARQALLDNPELVKSIYNEINPKSAMNSETNRTDVTEDIPLQELTPEFKKQLKDSGMSEEEYNKERRKTLDANQRMDSYDNMYDNMSPDDKLVDILHKRTSGTPKSMGKQTPKSMVNRG